MFRHLAKLSLCICLLAGWLPIGAQDKVAPVSPDFQIYNGVLALMQFPKQDPRIIIADTTLNSGCGEGSGNPVLLNGCGIIAASAVAEVGTLVTKSLPQLSPTTWQDLFAQSTSSTKLHDAFQSPWPHAVVDISAPRSDPWKSPDGAILFSRIGWNKEHTQALVYVLFFSYIKGLPTSGNFFLFPVNSGSQWEPTGRVTYMETQ